MSKENLLLSKNVVSILDGDELLDSVNGVDYKMPYLSGPIICEIGKSFGANMEYPWKGASSRWSYMQELITFCHEKNKISKLLTYLFSKTQFSQINKTLLNGSISINEYSEKVIELAIGRINDILKLADTCITKKGDFYSVISTSKAKPNIEDLTEINNDYIQQIIERANDDIRNGNYDSAITKSRTMLEEIFCYIIEKENQVPNDSGKIDDLFKQVKNIMKMNTNPALDTRINGLLSGLNSIVNNIASMRNISSDSHGVGSARLKVESHHALLCVNCSMVLSEFILAAYNKKTTK